MDILIETVSITVSFVVLLLIPITLLTVVYLIKRNGLYISTNCWFCNSWTKVLYTNRNSFYCPSCLQYNGFTKDGGYNKTIEEQFDIPFCNYFNMDIKRETEPLSNGLCNYCNNNQQLKIRQLADFTPLCEKNYDIEVEHFRAQLEKSYKLCKKCDKVLKKTLMKQNAWIFGNRVRSLQKNGSLLLKQIKSKKPILKDSFILKCVKVFLFLSLLIILYHAVNRKVNYSEHVYKEYIPDTFVPYVIFLNNLSHMMLNMTEHIITSISNKVGFVQISGLKSIQFKNDILAVMWIGLILEIILFIWQPKSAVWKINELLSWIILFFTSYCSIHDDYLIYVSAIQVLCSIINMYSLYRNVPERRKRVRNISSFKKLQKYTENADYSDYDEDISGYLSNSSDSTNSLSQKSDNNSKCFNPFYCRSESHRFMPESIPQNFAHFNNSFTTARSTKSSPLFNTPTKNNKGSSCNYELSHSLDNLHLGDTNFKPQSCSTSPVFSVSSINRPILSPPKLKNITQNSWTAGGFWKNDVAVCPTPMDVTNLSRSSSQSSGFVSTNELIAPNTYNSLPPSRGRSLSCDFDKKSRFSEPAYHFKPINSSSNTNQSRNNILFNISNPQVLKQPLPNKTNLYYKSENMFYPVLRENNMLLIQGNNIPRYNFERSFSNLSLKSFNSSSGFNSPSYREKPIVSTLFKNIQYVNSQSQNFKTSHC